MSDNLTFILRGLVIAALVIVIVTLWRKRRGGPRA